MIRKSLFDTMCSMVSLQKMELLLPINDDSNSKVALAVNIDDFMLS